MTTWAQRRADGSMYTFDRDKERDGGDRSGTGTGQAVGAPRKVYMSVVAHLHMHLNAPQNARRLFASLR